MEEKKITEAEVEKIEENEIKKKEIYISEEENEPKKKIDFRFELALFLILGFLLGVVIKSEAVKRITIGFNDSEITTARQVYNFDKIKQDLAKAAATQQEQAASGSDTSSQNNQ